MDLRHVGENAACAAQPSDGVMHLALADPGRCGQTGVGESGG